ncbi:MAG: biopolymer transporter ExbD [Verrucomicrobia bacterium]|nr:biopolymer transporter ExbD [Verrucomicrobiota bacterium]
MRRFSQRNPLVTLSDINITPLLDLAFVLLIIFVITTPMLQNSMKMDLPSGGQPNQPKLDKNDIRTVEISVGGEYRLNKRTMTLSSLEAELVAAHRRNPRLIVDVRADKRASWELVAAVFDACTRNGITEISPMTAPPSRR